MGDLFQIYLHPVGQFLPLHSIHLVQAVSRNQHHLKGSVLIKIGQQLLAVLLLVRRLLDGLDQGAGDLLIRGSLHEDPDAEVLDHICQMDFPGDGQERKIIFIAVINEMTRNLGNVISRVDDQPGRMAANQVLNQLLQLFRRVESKPCCDRKLFSPKIPDDHRVFHHMNPADGVGPSLFAGYELHLVLLL